jgi:beta-phosphoglucomutase
MMKGVLFDMDGVLVDSEEYISSAAIEMFREKGINATAEDFIPFVGMGENRYLGNVATKYGMNFNIDELKGRTYAIYDSIVKGKMKPLPGAIEFVKSCRDSRFRIALATSADRVKMEINMREIGLSEKDFDAVINGLEVKRKKPFPDIYLLAAKRIGLTPSDCLVAEDAVSGVTAAKAAGCRCLALLTSFKASELKEADWICPSLAEVPPEAISW